MKYFKRYFKQVSNSGNISLTKLTEVGGVDCTFCKPAPRNMTYGHRDPKPQRNLTVLTVDEDLKMGEVVLAKL